MDAIGEAAFDYRFNAMEDHESDMVRGYNNLMYATPHRAVLLVLT